MQTASYNKLLFFLVLQLLQTKDLSIKLNGLELLQNGRTFNHNRVCATSIQGIQNKQNQFPSYMFVMANLRLLGWNTVR